MHPLATLPYTTVELTWDRELPGPAAARARELRGALGRAFADDDLFHQHDGQGQSLYRYPLVQYRWHQGRGLVVGWREAAGRLLQLPWLDLSLRLGSEETCVTDAMLTTNRVDFGVSGRLLRYRLASPVLLFNQKNYPRYRAMDRAQQGPERDRLLVAQLLVALRGLRVDFDQQLYAAFCQPRPQPCRYKEQDLLGLGGGFLSNAVLPAGLAVGHAVSHGFGWVVPADATNEVEP